MRFFRKSHSLRYLLLGSVICYILAPWYRDLLARDHRVQDRPVIVHAPVKTAFQGVPISITARVSDEDGIEQVVLNLRLRQDGQVIDTMYPMANTFASEAIKVRVISETAAVYSAPTSFSDTLIVVQRGAVLDTYGIQEEYGFYHIGLSDEREGWLSLADAVIDIVGDIYRSTIPMKYTAAVQIEYSIEAVNIHGERSRTPQYIIGLITLEEEAVQKDISQLEVSLKSLENKAPNTRPFYKSMWFFGGLIAVGCGTTAYFLLSGKKEERGSLSVVVEW